MTTKRRFERAAEEGSSREFWEVSLEGTAVVTVHGQVGAVGELVGRDEGSAEKAEADYAERIEEKISEGYAETAVAAAEAPTGRYRARFVAMVDALRKDERFHVTKFKIGAPASAALIAEATEAAGGSLPPGVAELFAELNGFELVWTQIDGFDDALIGDVEAAGYINIPRIHGADGVFRDWRGALYFEDDDPLRQVKPIDNSGGELGANTLAVFFPVPGDATVHYHRDGDLHPTGYSLDEYVDRLLACRGYRYWMGSLCVDLQDDSATEELLNDGPLLFADFNAELFKPKTAEGQVAFD